MEDNKKNLILITPVRNEEKNLKRLYNSILCNSRKPNYWIIINNESTDKSNSIIEQFQKENKIQIIILNYKDVVTSYQLGFKYARIINFGFEYIKKNYYYDYIGILDADVFPEHNYFEEILKLLNYDSKVGISSGLCYDLNGKYDGEIKEAVRGNCRIWSSKCFDEAGYIIGPSADTLSLGLAEIKGYKPRAVQTVKCIIRPMGEKSKWKYYGYSANYRGIPLVVAIFKFLRVAYHNGLINGLDYLYGYLDNMVIRKEKLEHPELKRYFRRVSFNRLINIFTK